MYKQTHVYVTSMGMIVRLTVRNWTRWLKAVADGQEPNLLDYGTSMGKTTNVTDISIEDAQALIERSGQ